MMDNANNHTEKGYWVVPRLLFHTIFGLYIIEDLKLAPPLLLGIGEEPTVCRGAIP